MLLILRGLQSARFRASRPGSKLQRLASSKLFSTFQPRASNDDQPSKSFILLSTKHERICLTYMLILIMHIH